MQGEAARPGGQEGGGDGAARVLAQWPAGMGTGAIFPGGELSSAVRGDAPIGGDVLGPPDTPNHGGRTGQPDYPFGYLAFDGHVEIVKPGEAKHTLYAASTTGSRST